MTLLTLLGILLVVYVLLHLAGAVVAGPRSAVVLLCLILLAVYLLASAGGAR